MKLTEFSEKFRTSNPKYNGKVIAQFYPDTYNYPYVMVRFEGSSIPVNFYVDKVEFDESEPDYGFTPSTISSDQYNDF